MKLLDERGIGTVWSICKEKFALVGHTHNYAGSGSPGGSANSAIGVVDYNQTDKTIQIGYSGTGITGDQIKYIAGYTYGSGNVNAKIKDVSKDALKSWLGLGSVVSDVTFSLDVSTGDNKLSVTKADGTVEYKGVFKASKFNDGVMSMKDKVKLDGIEHDANNYTLPTASDTTLGGIKVSANAYGSSWPICVDDNGLANTKINGLMKNGNMLSRVVMSDEIYLTNYTTSGVYVEDRASKTNANIYFPKKSGVFALMSDVSNLCKFNFVGSIFECVSNRINFLFKNSNNYVDLSFLNKLEEGTILLIYSPYSGFQITNKSTVWYYNGIMKAADDTEYIDRAKLVLAFFYNTDIYVSTFSY